MTEPTVASAVLQDDGRYLITLDDGKTFYTAISSGEEIALLRSILATLGTISGLTGTGSLGAHGGIVVEGVASGTPQPVSQTTQPLPTGAATATKQDTGNASLASIATNTTGLAQESGGNLAAAASVLGTVDDGTDGTGVDPGQSATLTARLTGLLSTLKAVLAVTVPVQQTTATLGANGQTVYFSAEQGAALVVSIDADAQAFIGTFRFQLYGVTPVDIPVFDLSRHALVPAGIDLSASGDYLVLAPSSFFRPPTLVCTAYTSGSAPVVASTTEQAWFGFGAAGDPRGGVGSVQGVPGGTPLPTVSAGTPTNVAAVVITASTPHDLYTPAGGKKFRIVGYFLSVSVGAAVIFKYGSGHTEFLRTGAMAAGVGVADNLGNGLAPGAADDHLFLDVTSSGTVNGYVLLGADE